DAQQASAIGDAQFVGVTGTRQDVIVFVACASSGGHRVRAQIADGLGMSCQKETQRFADAQHGNQPVAEYLIVAQDFVQVLGAPGFGDGGKSGQRIVGTGGGPELIDQPVDQMLALGSDGP